MDQNINGLKTEFLLTISEWLFYNPDFQCTTDSKRWKKISQKIAKSITKYLKTNDTFYKHASDCVYNLDEFRGFRIYNLKINDIEFDNTEFDDTEFDDIQSIPFEKENDKDFDITEHEIDEYILTFEYKSLSQELNDEENVILNQFISLILVRANIRNWIKSYDERLIMPDREHNKTNSNLVLIHRYNRPERENIITKIETLISEIDRIKGWESIFFEEKDYLEYRDILINFFSDPNFDIPKTTINTKSKTIGKISILFKGLHEHFSEMRGHLLKDERFHKVVRILDEWKDKNSVQIYKAIYKG